MRNFLKSNPCAPKNNAQKTTYQSWGSSFGRTAMHNPKRSFTKTMFCKHKKSRVFKIQEKSRLAKRRQCPWKGLISRILLRGKPRQRYAPLTGRVFKIQKNICAVLRAMIMAVAAPLPLKGRVFKIQKKSRTIFDQINAITHWYSATIICIMYRNGNPARF